VLLDTPFGFQSNADELVAGAVRYFADSVGLVVQVARWRRADEPLLDRERTLALLGRAGWAFAGPGSPTYALRHWRSTGVPEALAEVAHRGTVVLGSAAACTAGTHAVPVYEIYKVGQDPHWEPALDLLGTLTGLRAVVVPHYDNAEGGRHDTRFCYLGEERLALLERLLPEDVAVLGVDEHTALVLDLNRRLARVVGNGGATVRRRGASTVLGAGEQVGFGELDALLRGRHARHGPAQSRPGPSRLGPSGSGRVPPAAAEHQVEAPEHQLPSLRATAAELGERFEAALAAGDVDGCLAAVLDLEAAIVAWSTDTDQNDDAETARRLLRGLIVRLADLARTGVRDPRSDVAPYVDLLLELRGWARDARDFSTSDLIRGRLGSAGVEIRDTPAGSAWSLEGAWSGTASPAERD